MRSAAKRQIDEDEIDEAVRQSILSAGLNEAAKTPKRKFKPEALSPGLPPHVGGSGGRA